MNVFMLCGALWPEGSGGELATYLYAKLLIKEGLDVKVAFPHTSGHYYKAWNELPIHNIPKWGHSKYSCIPTKRLADLIRWADVVYVTPPFWRLIMLAKHFNKPVVTHFHSYDPVCPVGSLYNFVGLAKCHPDYRKCGKCVWLYEHSHGRKLRTSLTSTALNGSVGRFFAHFLRYADALIFVSNAHMSLFLEHLRAIIGPVPPSYVIYNPVPDLPYIPCNDLNVGYFGGLSPLKGFHIILRAWTKIYPRYHSVKLLATKMGKLTYSHSLRKINIYVYDLLNWSEFDNLYSSIGLVVFPSIWSEPLPYVAIESLLRGRILIASKVGGVPEVVDNAPGVKLVPPNDVDALSDSLDWTLSLGRESVVELGLKNRENVLKRFNSRKSAKELIKVFEKVVE